VKRTLLYASGLNPFSNAYFVTVKLNAQIVTVTSNIASAAVGRRMDA
jgi:hypothetical protein